MEPRRAGASKEPDPAAPKAAASVVDFRRALRHETAMQAPVRRQMVVGSWLSFAVLVAVVIAVACGADGEAPATSSTDGGVTSAVLPESSAARDSLEAMRETFAHAVGSAGALAPGDVALFGVEGDRLVPEPVDPQAAQRVAHVRVTLPLAADGATEITDVRSGVSVRTALVDALPAEGAVADGLVVYGSAHVGGGELVHRVAASSTEEFVTLPSGGSELAWTVELGDAVAGLRLVGGVLELLDAGGAPRLRVKRPWVADAKGILRQASLDVSGCAVDTSGAPPWGRAVTPPTARSCRLWVRWDARDLEAPLLVDPLWQTADQPESLRGGHGGVVLLDGRAFVAGGWINTGTFMALTAELYDYPSDTWAATSPMGTARGEPSVTLLADGRVLVAGGSTTAGFAVSNSGEVWSPSTGTWAAVANTMSTARARHPAVRLQNGNVLLPGGQTAAGVYTNAASLYNPSTNLFSTTGVMTATRGYHTATGYSGNLEVLVAGGESPGALSTAEYYQQSTGTFTALTAMGVTRSRHAATILSTGNVLVVGGESGGSWLTRADTYLAATRTWSGTVTNMTWSRAAHTAVLRPNGTVLVAGGYANSNARVQSELFNGSVWTDAGNMGWARSYHTAHLLTNGDVLQAMGSNSSGFGFQQTSEVFQFRATSSPCGVSAQCETGYCVDGYCCNLPCTSLCNACSAAKKGSGANGTCGVIANGSDPDSECSDLGVAACNQDGFCNGAGACRLYPSGTVCIPPSCLNAVSTTSQCVAGSCVSTPASCSNYQCNGTACGSTCTVDSQCVAAAHCDSGGTCVADKANGASCTGSSQCTSGNCVDGVCCNLPCAGLCQACTAALKGSGSNGTCGNIANASDPQNECPDDGPCGRNGSCDGSGACAQYATGTSCGAPTCSAASQTTYTCNGAGLCNVPASTSCGNYQCNGNVCGTSCTTDANCVNAAWCRTSDSQCIADQAQGAACTAASQCASGNCVDGFCCNGACDLPCQACSAAKKGSGANGTCGSIVTGTDPDNECAASASATCGQDGFCNGSGACRSWASGTACGSPTCDAGTQTNTTCNGSGACSVPGTVGCGNYQCNGNVCGTSCTTDANCATAAWCRTSDSQCIADQAQGAACTAASQCASGNCVDGFCCNGACDLPCQACSAAKKGSGANGTCGSIVTGTDPDNECAASASATCGQDGFCNGSGACRSWASGTACGSPTCDAGTQTNTTCNGSGACSVPGTVGCGNYQCNGNVCGTSCTTDANCATAAWCRTSDSQCIADQAQGAACTASSQCASGFCVDGFCCNGACNLPCQACSAAKKGTGANGTCGVVAAGTDPDGECAADPVSSCDLDGQCDGVGACRLYASGTQCASPTCGGGTQVTSQCNGTGTCTGTNTSCAPYVCGTGGTCATSCASDAACVATSFCNETNGTCQPDRANGLSCGNANECVSGFCADGVCCDQACAGSCEACSAARKGSGTDGTCGAIAAGTDPDAECAAEPQSTCRQTGMCDGARSCALWAVGLSCGSTTCSAGTQTGFACDGIGTCLAGQMTACAPYVCGATACRVSCASDADCVPSAYCATDGTCRADQATGQPCAAASQCTSGFCTDGVCCDQACDAACEACTLALKGSGADGTCGDVGVDTDPDDDCAAEAATTCGRTGACDGTGGCKLFVQGTSCGANSCTATATLTGKQCDGFGACVDGQTTQCDPFVCASGACLTVCADDGECLGTHYCSANACVAKKDNGVACTAGNECREGFCVEGVCCNSACDGTCQSCTAAGKGAGADGACGLAAAGADPQGQCQDQGPTSCGRDGQCDGQGECRRYAAGTKCGDTSCVDNVQTGFGCDGFGTCQPGQKTDCGAYACKLDQCVASCAADADCAPSAFCEVADSECKPKDPDGTACTESASCASGFCVDGFCCGRACDGQCEACDVAASPGTCTPIVGPPHGTRTACADGGGDPCALRLCDGQTTSSCQGFAGSDVGCRDQSCTDGVETFSATCNGQGQCGPTLDATQSKVCFPFVCGDGSCKGTCAADGDCAQGNVCRGTQCVSGATCKDDVTVVDISGEERSCSPFLCVAGACQGFCASSSECAPGFVCDTEQGQGVCIPPALGSAPADEGGCGCRTAPTRGAPGAVTLALALLAGAFARRRRARSPRGPAPGAAHRA